ncbi:MAG: hypothetical protein H6982_16900 [Chromatiales bacterium]|nr:hypothetical protein [Chromatiales bacterium]
MTTDPLDQDVFEPTLADVFGPVVHTYSRTDAIADGVLVDVSALAADAGFRYPVAITRAAWADCVAWTDDDTARQVHQDETGRLWDVLWMAHMAIRRVRNPDHQLFFELLRVPRDGHSTEAVETRLQVVAGPGDHGEPVLTILLPGED